VVLEGPTPRILIGLRGLGLAVLAAVPLEPHQGGGICVEPPSLCEVEPPQEPQEPRPAMSLGEAVRGQRELMTDGGGVRVQALALHEPPERESPPTPVKEAPIGVPDTPPPELESAPKQEQQPEVEPEAQLERIGALAEAEVAKRCMHVRLCMEKRRIELLKPIKFHGSKHADGVDCYKFPKTAEKICEEVGACLVTQASLLLRAYSLCAHIAGGDGPEDLQRPALRGGRRAHGARG
jgi:hypothetical protein